MTPDQAHPDVSVALRAARRVIADERVVEQLRADQGWEDALRQLHLSASAELRDALLEIVDQAQLSAVGSQPLDAGNGREERRAAARSVLMRGYGQIRLSFWFSLVMSAILFIVGLALLGLAAAEALSSGELSAQAVAVAGLGLADFVLVFYTRPSKDIARNLAATQRSQFLATTYLSGVSLIASNDAEALDQLIRLTERMVALTGSPEEQAADATAPLRLGRRDGCAANPVGTGNT